MKLDCKKKKKINLKSIHYKKKGNAIDKIPICTLTFLKFFLHGLSFCFQMDQKNNDNQSKKFFLLFGNSSKKTFN